MIHLFLRFYPLNIEGYNTEPGIQTFDQDAIIWIGVFKLSILECYILPRMGFEQLLLHGQKSSSVSRKCP